jgi:hypothetical protein
MNDDRPEKSRSSESAAPGDAEIVAPGSKTIVLTHGLQPFPLPK